MAIKIGNQISYVGLVLELHQYVQTFDNGYDHISNAIVWNMAKMLPETITYYCSMPGSEKENGTAEIDANPFIRELYTIHMHNKRMDSIALQASSEYQAQLGDTIKVVKGKKCPIGVIGEVIRKQLTQFGNRYVIRDAKHEYSLWEGNYEVIARPLDAKPKDLEPKKAFSNVDLVKYKLSH